MSNETATREGVAADEGKPDWEAIERDYRAGILSIRELASQHGVSDTAIRKHAKKHGWTRDLTAKVQERAKALVVRAEVRTANNLRTERELVEEAAQTVAAVQMLHRRDVAAGRGLVELLMTQLHEAASHRDDIEEAIDEEYAEDMEAAGKNPGAKEAARVKRTMMRRAVSLPTHAMTIRNLANAMKALIPLERQAFNLGDETPPPPPPDGTQASLEQLGRLANKLFKIRAPVTIDAKVA